MDAGWVEIAKTIGAAVGLLTGGFVTYWQIRQRTRQKAYDLEDNPERCGRHEEAIKQLRSDMDDMCEENRDDHREMLKQIAGLSVEMARASRHEGSAK